MIGIEPAHRAGARRAVSLDLQRLAAPAAACLPALLALVAVAALPARQPRALLLLASGRAAAAGHGLEVGWLGALTLHAADAFAGYAGTIACDALAVFALSTFVYARARSRASAPLAFGASLLAVFACCGGLQLGGDAAAWLGGAAFLYALDRAPRRGAWLAPAIAIVWCNASPAGLLAPALGLMLALGRVVSAGSPRPARPLWPPLAASCAALLATPAGMAYPAAAAAALHFGGIYASLLTVAPLQVSPVAFRPLAALTVLGAAYLWRSRVRASDVPLLLAAFFLVFVDGAFLPLLGIVAAPAFAAALARTDAGDARAGGRVFAAGFAALLVALLALGTLSHAPAATFLRDSPRSLFDRLASDGKQHVVACGVVAWCDLAILHPNLRALLDERVERVDPSVLQTEDTIGHVRPGWRAALRRSGADALILRLQSAPAQLLALESGWHAAASDGSAVLFKRESAR